MLRNERWSESPIDGFNIGVSLMANTIEDLKRDIQKKMPKADKKAKQLGISNELDYIQNL